MSDYVESAPTLLASFAASLVECVEALTVVLAVGTVRGWRWALVGCAAALCVLLASAGLFGRSMARLPLPAVQLGVGTLLLLFGLRWLRKAILRSAGVIALHDEAVTYAEETDSLRARGLPTAARWDEVAFAAAFKIVMLEGIEVVFIAIGMGSDGRLLLPAALGALAALLVVVCLGVWLHRPLANIPENAFKFGVGVLLTAFGVFWVGEAVRFHWPAGDWSLLVLIATYLCVARALVFLARSMDASPPRHTTPPAARRPAGLLASVLREVWSLFVDDRGLALGTVLWTAGWWSVGSLPLPATAQCAIFVLGVAALLGCSLRSGKRSC
jgi:uncharacterized membrane protein